MVIATGLPYRSPLGMGVTTMVADTTAAITMEEITTVAAIMAVVTTEADRKVAGVRRAAAGTAVVAHRVAAVIMAEADHKVAAVITEVADRKAGVATKWELVDRSSRVLSGLWSAYVLGLDFIADLAGQDVSTVIGDHVVQV